MTQITSDYVKAADRKMFRITMDRLIRADGFEFAVQEIIGQIEQDLVDMPQPQHSQYSRLAERLRNLRQWWLAERAHSPRSLHRP